MREHDGQRPFTVVLTGPESTGKTTLAKELAEKMGGEWVPEYARTRVSGLQRPYVYEDLLHILDHQKKVTEDIAGTGKPFLFLDTDLVILKVWFREVFGKMPEEMDDLIRNRKIDLYLLCRPDIPWVWDPVRENPGSRREELFDIYEKELLAADLPYEIVEGRGEERLEHAAAAVREYYHKRTHEHGRGEDISV